MISTVTTTGATVTIAGTFNSRANSTYDLDFYSNPAADANPQGRTYLGTMTVVTDGARQLQLHHARVRRHGRRGRQDPRHRDRRERAGLPGRERQHVRALDRGRRDRELFDLRPHLARRERRLEPRRRLGPERGDRLPVPRRRRRRRRRCGRRLGRHDHHRRERRLHVRRPRRTTPTGWSSTRSRSAPTPRSGRSRRAARRARCRARASSAPPARSTAGATRPPRTTRAPCPRTSTPPSTCRASPSPAPNATGVDSGFSFSAIVNTRGDTTDDDGGATARLHQGSLRQFILNANAIAGVQTSNFSVGTGRDHDRAGRRAADDHRRGDPRRDDPGRLRRGADRGAGRVRRRSRRAPPCSSPWGATAAPCAAS